MLNTSQLYDKAMRLNDADFKQIIGVKKQTFALMLAELQNAYNAKHKRRGRHCKLPLEDTLFMSLKYLRQYITQKELAFEFALSEASVCDRIRWVEDTLVASGKFKLPGKKALLEEPDIKLVLVDVTESAVERPKKNNAPGIPAKRNATPSKRNCS